MKAILKLFEKFESTLKKEQLYPEIKICSDGSGVVVNQQNEPLIRFGNVEELKQKLKQAILSDSNER